GRRPSTADPACDRESENGDPLPPSTGSLDRRTDPHHHRGDRHSRPGNRKGLIMTDMTSLTASIPAAPQPETVTLTSVARVPTKSALRYLGQLCKHFGHRVPSCLDGDHGWIAFEFGR